jgi:broad specificity phosphatase PhoE
MHLYLIRHADPDYGTDSLTPQGFAEARALCARLETAGLTHLYSSTAGRARLTARPVSERLSLPVEERAWLLEPAHLRVRQGGRDYTMWDLYGETVRAHAAPLTQESWTAVPPYDSPAVRQMWADFRRSADGLLAAHGMERAGCRYRRTGEGRDRVALFCHNGTVLLFIAHLLELPLPLVWCGFFAWPSSVTVFHFESHSDAWAVPRALSVADVSHLYAAGLQPQPRAFGPDRFEPFL